VQEITVYGHSTLLYWWPAWAIVFLSALLNAGQERFFATVEGARPSFDTNGLRFEKLGSNFFRMVLGFGAGDLKATITGDRGTTIEIPNVVLDSRKVHFIERLISVMPERAS
jgi:hypothetical protein